MEHLPFADAAFDTVISQYGHIFAPRPAVAIAEMLRVLKPGGTIAFSTWPNPILSPGHMFALSGRRLPSPPGVPAPTEWGDRSTSSSNASAAPSATSPSPTAPCVDRSVLSPQHHRLTTENTSCPMLKLIAELSVSDPAKLAAFRHEYDALAAEVFHDNTMHQVYLMTRATKI